MDGIQDTQTIFSSSSLSCEIPRCLVFVLGWRLVLSLLLLDVNTKFAAARSGEQSQLAVAERKLKYCVAALPLEEKNRQSFTRGTQISRKKNSLF